MKQKFDFNKKFQEGIIHYLMVKQKFADYCIPKLKPDYFTSDIAALLFDLIDKYYKKYRKINYYDIINEIKILKTVDKKKKKVLYGYAKKVYMGTYNYKYIVENIVEFVKSRIYIETFHEGYDLINEGKFDVVNVKMRELSRLEFDTHIGLSFSKKTNKEIASRISADEKEDVKYIPTGINRLDYFIKGARKGELCLFLAGPSAGKSFGLVHIAKYAMIRGKKILYYTLELAEDLIFQRFIMSTCKMTTEETINDLNKVYKRLDKLNRLKIGEIIIKQFGSATVEDLRCHYNYMLYQGFKADMIIVDYLDYLKALNHRLKSWEQVNENVKGLRAMAVDFDIPIWSASGSVKAAKDKEVVGMADEMGSYGKSYMADVIIGISSTEEERKEDEDKHTRAKLYIAKSRSKGNADKVIPLVQDKHRMQFWVKDKEYLNLVKDEEKNKKNDKKQN